MTFADIDWVGVALRTGVYVAAIAAAGGVLFYASMPQTAWSSSAIRRQILVGVIILCLVEPLRYVHFQLAIAGGDLGLAFDPSMRWMAFDTPIGEAGLVRVVSALAILIGGIRLWPMSVVGALGVVGSFALEGHTAAHETARPILAALLVAHLAVAHWWLGALYPIRAATVHGAASDAARLAENFGKRALVLVAVLALAGAAMMALLSDWHIDLTRAHHGMFAVKLTVFTAILAVAAVNKLRWAPLLASDPQRARSGLRKSLNIEIGLCAAILIATAIMISFSPEP